MDRVERLRLRRGRAGVSTAPWVVLAGLVTLPLAVLVGWGLVARADNPTAAAAPVKAVVVPVTQQDVRAQTDVTVKLVYAPGRVVLASGNGTLTATAKPGTRLDNGVEVVRVDDKPVRAMVSDAPLWRSVATGDKGVDVQRIEEFLSATGYFHGTPDAAFTTETRAAVERFNVDAGLGATVRRFDPATVIWIGPEPLTAAKIDAVAGTALTAGTPVMEGPETATSVEVMEPPGGLSTVGEFGDTAELIIGGTTAPYVPGSGMVTDPTAVDSLRTALAPAVDGQAQVRALASHPVKVVPASALVQGEDGTICVYASAEAEPLIVSPVGGGMGSTQLPADVALDEVLSNPGRVPIDMPCAS